MIRSIAIRELRRKLADAVNRVLYRGEHIAVTRRDEIVAVLIPYEDLKELRRYREKEGVRSDVERLMDRVIDQNEKLYTMLAEE